MPLDENMAPPKISAAEVYQQLKRQIQESSAAGNAVAQEDEDEQQIQQPEVSHRYKKTFEVPDIYQFPFDKPGLDRPWNESKEKSDEYFNYGR